MSDPQKMRAQFSECIQKASDYEKEKDWENAFNQYQAASKYMGLLYKSKSISSNFRREA